MNIEQRLNERHAAPRGFWIELALLAVATIIVVLLLSNSDRKDQFNMEKKTTYLKTEFYGKKEILSFAGA